MKHPRIIPILLLDNNGLYKTIKYKKPIYIGDPINTLKIFNEKETDELIIIDISATSQKKQPNFSLLKEIASECFMPICYGGGINTIEHIKKLFNLGIEKVALNTALTKNPDLLKEAVKLFGSQSIVGIIDVNKNIFGNYKIYNHITNKNKTYDIPKQALYLQSLGIGELLLNFVHLEGSKLGYDISFLKSITNILNIPVIVNGGVGKFEHLKEGIIDGKASAAAAGSFFVFHGPHNAVLITYPNHETIRDISSL